VERNVTRCDRIIDELLSYTRSNELDRVSTPIDAWVNETLDELAVPNEVTLVRRVGSEATVDFDQERVRRALINVVDNACQAMLAAEGGPRTLTVTTQQSGPRVEIRVDDTGPGIPAHEIERVFEPLYSTKSFGVGLGLAIARRTMQHHGGDVEMESTVGSGTSVVLWLPCSECDAVTERQGGATDSGPAPPKAG